MIKLLVDSIWDVISVTIKLTKEVFNIKTDNRFNSKELEIFFKAIQLQNKNLLDNNTPKLIKILEQTERLDKFILSNPYLKINDFQEKEEQFKAYFESKLVKFEHDYNNKNIIVTSYKKLMKDFYNFKYVKCSDTEFFTGYNLFEEECIFSLRRNMLIAGNVGMGKTSTIQGIILNRLWNNKNNENAIGTEFHLIDLKGTDLIHFNNIENVIEIATDSEAAKKVFNNLMEEMNKRKEIFIRNKVSNIEDYNQKSKIKMKYKYLIIDELASFQELGKKEKEEIDKLFLSLASKSRAFGIIIIGATQRPDSKTLDSFIKAQLSGVVVGHGVNNKYTSETIINKEGLEKIKQPGRAMILGEREEIIQFPYISSKELKIRLKKDL